MQNFLFTLPTRVVFGPGVIDTIGDEVAAHGHHALLVTGSTFVRRSGLIDHILRSLDTAHVRVTVYDGLTASPSVQAVDRGGNVARDVGADVVVGLGGGSAMDAAKAIAVAAITRRSVWEFADRGVDPASSAIDGALPIIQVPIIASTGSETSNTAVLLNEDTTTKAPLRSDRLYGRVAVIDPTLTFTVPAHYTAVGAMNIVSQLMEGYLTNDEFAVTDRLTEGLMRVVMDSLPRVLRRAEDLDARTNLSWTAAIASAVGGAGRGTAAPIREMAYQLTARFNVDHGMTVAALWPTYMRYALSNRYRLPHVGRFKRYALLGRQVFSVHETDDEVAAEITTYRITHWLRELGMPTDLLQLGIEEVPVAELAHQVVTVSGMGGRLPRGLGAGDIQHIYEGSLRPN